MSCESAFNFQKRQEWGGVAGSVEDRTDGLDSPDRVTPPGQSSPPPGQEPRALPPGRPPSLCDTPSFVRPWEASRVLCW